MAENGTGNSVYIYIPMNTRVLKTLKIDLAISSYGYRKISESALMCFVLAAALPHNQDQALNCARGNFAIQLSGAKADTDAIGASIPQKRFKDNNNNNNNNSKKNTQPDSINNSN